jgi:hypothetical protein
MHPRALAKRSSEIQRVSKTTTISDRDPAMHTTPSLAPRLTAFALAALTTIVTARAQSAFGVDSNGDLFRFDLSSPATTYTIGNLGFVPEGLDFRTGTGTLYAIDVGASLTQLYTVDTATGAATTVGAGFASAGTFNSLSYSLLTSGSFAFDFNPTTLQADGSIRIRFIGDNGVNLRLHSGTGGIAAVDGAVSGAIAGAAYINNAFARMGGATGLYDVDTRTNSLFLQNPPNAGSLVLVGALGIDVGDDVGFDILTSVNAGDDGIGGDMAFLVDSLGSYSNLYSVDLATGAASSLGVIARSFEGGFAIASPVPEPSHYGLAASALLLGYVAYRQRKRHAG